MFFFKQKTAYEMRISDWSSDVCSSDLPNAASNEHHVGTDQRGRRIVREGHRIPGSEIDHHVVADLDRLRHERGEAGDTGAVHVVLDHQVIGEIGDVGDGVVAAGGTEDDTVVAFPPNTDVRALVPAHHVAPGPPPH